AAPGEKGAARLLAWLSTHADALGLAVTPAARAPRRSLSSESLAQTRAPQTGVVPPERFHLPAPP
ncbi:MAG: hypothetical protein WCA12_17020, partial [Burkholderiales bacterium]